MGWFDEQIKERNRADDEALEESFLRIAGAVMGKRLSAALNDRRRSAKDAIEELLKYYRVKTREVPRSVMDMNEILEFLLRPYGIMRRNVKLEKFWYRDATGPMLGTRTDDGSVVALIPDAFSGYSFFRPYRTTSRCKPIEAADQRRPAASVCAHYRLTEDFHHGTIV